MFMGVEYFWCAGWMAFSVVQSVLADQQCDIILGSGALNKQFVVLGARLGC